MVWVPSYTCETNYKGMSYSISTHNMKVHSLTIWYIPNGYVIEALAEARVDLCKMSPYVGGIWQTNSKH
jgi:hypothetical protein